MPDHMSDTPAQASSNKKTYVINAASFIAMLAFVLVSAWNSQDDISQRTFITCLYLSIFLELVSIGAMLELAFASTMELASFRWAFAAVLAVVAYFGRAQSMVDVNAVFHVDPGALPMTVAAGTAMRVAAYLFWPMAVISGVSVVALITLKWGGVLDKADDITKVSAWSRAVFALIASSLALLIIHGQLSDSGIKTKLYRLTHDTDFNATFDCQGFSSEEFDALFLGPEQRRALFAPKIAPEFSLNESREQPELLKPIKIPEGFIVAECVPENKAALGKAH